MTVVDTYEDVTLVERYWQRKTEVLVGKPAPVPLCPPQILYKLTFKFSEQHVYKFALPPAKRPGTHCTRGWVNLLFGRPNVDFLLVVNLLDFCFGLSKLISGQQTCFKLRSHLPLSFPLNYSVTIPQSVLRNVLNPFQSQFSTECDLVLPFPIYIILFFLKVSH
jgi:hypothetical protein